MALWAGKQQQHQFAMYYVDSTEMEPLVTQNSKRIYLHNGNWAVCRRSFYAELKLEYLQSFILMARGSFERQMVHPCSLQCLIQWRWHYIIFNEWKDNSYSFYYHYQWIMFDNELMGCIEYRKHCSRTILHNLSNRTDGDLFWWPSPRPRRPNWAS